MIPKIIHFVWVGNNQKSELIKSCMRSWKKHLPDYKIIEWGNDEVIKINNQYVKDAFENRMWAFVSDYVRLKALYEHGGFYFDTDLEVTQNLEQFRNFEFFSGFENFNGKISPITACMGAEKGSILIQKLLREYENERFFTQENSFNIKTNTQRITEFFRKNFTLPQHLDPTTALVLSEKTVIFPSFYFCTPEAEKINYAIHHFDGSWHVGYFRNCIAKLGRLKILLLRKISNKSSHTLPIYGNERLVWKSPLFFRFCFAAVKKNKNAP